MQLHTITLQMTGSWQKVKGKQMASFWFLFFSSLYFAKNTCVLGSQVRNALFMHEFARHQLSYRQETLWSPSWEQSLSLLPVWIVHERVRQVGSRLRAEVEGRSFILIFIFVYMQECLPELGVVGELAWLFCTAAAAACAAFTAVLAAYRLASSWNLPIFFLYRILLLPNQLDTCVREQKEEEQKESDVKQPQHRALSSVIVSRCHVWVHQVPNSQPLQ